MASTSVREYTSSSEEHTKSIAQQIAQKCNPPSVYLLYGDLGAGKTTFVRGFAEGLGIQNTIASPSYTYLRTYKTPDGRTLYHFDLYLLSENKGDVSSLFLDEALEDPDGIVIIEWANHLPVNFSLSGIKIRIETQRDADRKIIFDT